MSTDKKNSIWLAVQYIFTILTSFIILKFYLSYFGQELFGLWILFSSFWSIGSLIDMGLSLAMVRFIAQARNSGNTEDVQQYIISGLLVYILLGLVVFGIIYNLSELIIFNTSLIPLQYLEISKVLFILVGIHFFMLYLFFFFRSVLEGMNMFVLTSRVYIFYNILQFVLVFGVIMLELSILHMALGYMIATSTILFINIYFLRFKFRIFRFRFNLFSPLIIKSIIRYSFSLQVASIAGALIDPIIKYIIGTYASLSYVSYFEVARRFTTALTGLYTNSFKNFLPKISILTTHEMDKYLLNEGAGLAKMGVVYSGLSYGICQIAFAFIIQFWFGFNESILIFLLISAPEVINNFGYSLYIFLIGIGRTTMLAYFQLINLVTTTISLLVGFIIFDNIVGIIGYFFSVLLVNILILIFLKRVVHFSRKEFLQRAGVNKLMILVLLIYSAFVVIQTGILSIYISLSVLSLISLLIFYSDIRKYLFQILKFRNNAIIV